MTRAVAIVFALLFATTVAVSAQEQAAPAPASDASGSVYRESELDRMTREVAAQLRCVVCQGLSIQDSPSSLAQEMRAVVREQLELGRSPDEVKEYFVAKYGEWVLLRPKARGFNLLVYVMPVVILLGGAVFIYSKARKWTNAAPADVDVVEDDVEAQQY